MSKLKVYYNSACPVCNAGIKGQKGRMEACNVEWIDIHSDAAAVDEIGADREFVRERLHVVDERGQLQVGASAFATLWQHTEGQQWLARLVHLPVIRVLVRWLYNAFAAALYAWNRALGHWQIEKQVEKQNEK